MLSDSDSISTRKFVAERNVNFSFMFVYSPDSVNENKLLFELARFNFTNFIVRNFDVIVDEQGALHRMRISGFMSYDEAMQYARQVGGNARIRSLTGKARTFVISDSNLELLGTQYSYNDYDKFYEQHFVPLRISTVKLLTEPASIEYEPSGESDADGLYQGGVIEDGLFIDDESPATGGSGTDDLIIMPDEQNNAPAVSAPADAGAITIPVEPETKAGGTDDGTMIVPDVQDNAPETGSNDGDLFIIDDGKQNAQQTEPDSGETFIPLDGGNPAGGTNTQPAAGGQTPGHDSGNKQPAGAQAGSNAGQPSGTQTTQDDFIIEFNDDYERRTSNTNSGNAQQDDDRQDSYGLEDEYYDLDGF